MSGFRKRSSQAGASITELIILIACAALLGSALTHLLDGAPILLSMKSSCSEFAEDSELNPENGCECFFCSDGGGSDGVDPDLNSDKDRGPAFGGK